MGWFVGAAQLGGGSPRMGGGCIPEGWWVPLAGWWAHSSPPSPAPHQKHHAQHAPSTPHCPAPRLCPARCAPARRQHSQPACRRHPGGQGGDGGADGPRQPPGTRLGWEMRVGWQRVMLPAAGLDPAGPDTGCSPPGCAQDEQPGGPEERAAPLPDSAAIPARRGNPGPSTTTPQGCPGMWQPRSLGESEGSGTGGGCSVPPRSQASLRRAAGPPAAGVPEQNRSGAGPGWGRPDPFPIPRPPGGPARGSCSRQWRGTGAGPSTGEPHGALPAVREFPRSPLSLPGCGVAPGRAGDSRGRRVPALARAGPAQTKRGPRPGPVRRAGAGTGGGEPGTPPAAPPVFVCRGSRGRRGAQRRARPVLPGGSVHKGRRRRRGQRGGGGGRAHQSVGLSSPITSW